MKVVLDAGALIGIDRNDRRVAGLILLARRENATLTTTSPIVGQVWRDGSRQAVLARTLAMVDVRSPNIDDAKRAGELLKNSQTGDIVDALLTLLVSAGDQVLTSDPKDIASLLDTRRVEAVLIPV